MTSTPPATTSHPTGVRHDSTSTLTIIGRCRTVSVQPQPSHPETDPGTPAPATFTTAFGEQIALNPDYLERVGKSVRGDTLSTTSNTRQWRRRSHSAPSPTNITKPA